MWFCDIFVFEFLFGFFWRGGLVARFGPCTPLSVYVSVIGRMSNKWGETSHFNWNEFEIKQMRETIRTSCETCSRVVGGLKDNIHSNFGNISSSRDGGQSRCYGGSGFSPENKNRTAEDWRNPEADVLGLPLAEQAGFWQNETLWLIRFGSLCEGEQIKCFSSLRSSELVKYKINDKTQWIIYVSDLKWLLLRRATSSRWKRKDPIWLP